MFIVDYAPDIFEEWVQGLETPNYDEALHYAEVQLNNRLNVKIWDENDRLLWDNGKSPSPFYEISPFEREWISHFGNLIPRYCATIDGEGIIL